MPKTSLSEAHDKHVHANYHEESLKHWRAWGSWFSWGSPTGLGLFLLLLAAAFWVVVQALK